MVQPAQGQPKEMDSKAKSKREGVHPRRPSVLFSTLAGLFVLIMATTPALGLTFHVIGHVDGQDNNPGDGVCYSAVQGLCTLRAAVEESNAFPGVDLILIPGGEFDLETALGQLNLTDSVDIEGAGAWDTLLQAGSSIRFFEVEAGVTASITDMTMRGARAGFTSGGAVKGEPGRDIDLFRVFFDDNRASGGCGAVSTRGTITVFDSTFRNNNGGSEAGGAVCVTFGAQAFIGNSTFYGNHASIGGAIYMVSSDTSLTLRNSTLIENDAQSPASGSIYFGFGTLTSNRNLIWPDECHIWDLNALTSLGGNAVGPGNGCVLPHQSDQVNLDWADLDLGLFRDYGGPVPTMLPGTQSAAVNPPWTAAFCPSFDARGEPRLTLCDAGAVERQPDDPESGPLFVDGFESGDVSFWSAASP